MKLQIWLLFIALCFVFTQSQAQSAEIVVNGGFETGDFSGWMLSGNTDFTGVDAFLPHTGRYAASIAPVGSLGYLTQTLPTVEGATYSLSFWLANDGGTPNGFQALWGGVPVVTLTDEGPFDYRNFTASVVAPGEATEVSFVFVRIPDPYISTMSL